MTKITTMDDDDDDVQLIKHVVNLEPIVIDLTDSDDSDPTSNQQPHTNFQQRQANVEQPSESQPNFEQPTESQPNFEQPSESQPNFEQPTESQPNFEQPTESQPNFEQPTEPQANVEQPSEPLANAEQPSEPQANIEQPLEPQANVEVSTQPQINVQKPKKPQLSDHELMMAQKTLGNEKYKHNLFDDAIRIYKRANELAKKLGNKEMSAILHFNLAMTYYKLGSFDQAADECANAVKINDKYMKAHLKRAEIYQRQCKFEEAVICYEHICELDGNNQDYAVLLNYAKEAAKKTKKRDCFQILGLNTNFTHEDLKKAYRQQALSHHPDRHSDADIVTRRIEEKQFKDASEAHTFIQVKYGYKR